MKKDWGTFWDFLRLEEIQDTIFKGNSIALNSGRIYGGQVFAQAIAAASQTVAEGRRLHSAHSYFLRYGDDSEPVIFMIENTRDGRNYSSRNVTAVQKGRPIFTLLCSFAQEEEVEFSYERESTINLDGIKNMLEVDLSSEERNELKMLYRAGRLGQWPIDLRFFAKENDEYFPNSLYGIKLKNPADKSDQNTAMAMLGFASDFGLLPSTMRAVGYDQKMNEVMMATVCHTMWVHQRVDLNGWLYMHAEPQVIDHGRALVKGSFYNEDGQLLATLMQEGVARITNDT